MQDNKDAAAEADAATDRLQKGLRAAKSIVRDYKEKLCRKSVGEPRETGNEAFSGSTGSWRPRRS